MINPCVSVIRAGSEVLDAGTQKTADTITEARDFSMFAVIIT
jgi:hypothetical protein